MAAPPHIQQYRCPLCNRDKPMGRKAKKLYNGWACASCINGFANRRQAAYLIDSFAIFLLFLGIGFVLEFIGIDINWPQRTIFASFSFIIALTVFQLYNNVISFPFYLKDGWKGRSPGKWVCGITVVDETSREPIGFGQSFKRNIPLAIPFAVLVALVQMMKGRRLGDKWAHTRVVWNKYKHRFPFEDRAGICLQCGYDLRGNVSGRCPECGADAPIAPADESTEAPLHPPTARPTAPTSPPTLTLTESQAASHPRQNSDQP